MNSFQNERHYGWMIACFFSFFVFTAVIHNCAIYPSQCLLNFTGETDYKPAAFYKLLSRDPALPIAFVLTVLIYFLGSHYNRFRKFIYVLPPSFLAYVFFIWDIPFSKRVICRTMHDGRFFIYGCPVRSRYLLLVSVVFYLLAIIGAWLKEKSSEKTPIT